MAPINGRLVDVAGRRLTLFTAIGFILIFSTLSGIAKDVKLCVYGFLVADTIVS